MEPLGPIISTILALFKDIAKFFCIWAIILSGYSITGNLFFFDMEEF